MVKLGVNIDHIATLRQARLAREPDVLEAALACERAGAEGITVHLREDRRHIQDSDVVLLRKKICSKLNLEMAATEEITRIALKIKPDDVCLVPEKRRELTTEGGLDAAGQRRGLARTVARLSRAGICVSLFIDPTARQVRAAKDIGAACVELHTGVYAEACMRGSKKNIAAEIKRLTEAALLARGMGLTVNAGHGLDYNNVVPVAKIMGMHELNIGFSIIARAVFVGLEKAVREMKCLIRDLKSQI